MVDSTFCAYDLPTSVNVCGVVYSIRYNWRAILDILVACSDPNLNDQEKAECLIKIFYPEWEQIPYEHLQEACEQACAFIDCGHKKEETPKPQTIDWEKDAPLIIPEVNKVAGKEVRLYPDIHWWTFFGWFMEIGDGLFSSVLNIRNKKNSGKKLEKWEQDFYKENKKMIDIRKPEKEEVKKEKELIMKYL